MLHDWSIWHLLHKPTSPLISAPFTGSESLKGYSLKYQHFVFKSLYNKATPYVPQRVKPGSYFLRMRMQNECGHHRAVLTTTDANYLLRSCDVKIRRNCELGLAPYPPVCVQSALIMPDLPRFLKDKRKGWRPSFLCTAPSKILHSGTKNYVHWL